MAKRKRGSGKVFASVLITALIVGGIGFASSGFSKWNKEDWEARLIPERVFEVAAVEKSAEFVNSPDTTITADETEANLYHVGGAILYQEEEIEGLTGHLYEAKITLKDVNLRTAALKVSKGLDETVKTADLKWLAEDNSYTLLDVAEIGVDTVLTFDNDGDFETLDDQVVLTFKIDPLVKSQAVLLDINHDLTLPESPWYSNNDLYYDGLSIQIKQTNEDFKNIYPDFSNVNYYFDIYTENELFDIYDIYVDGVLINLEDGDSYDDSPPDYLYGFNYEEQFINLKVIEIMPLVEFVGLKKLTART